MNENGAEGVGGPLHTLGLLEQLREDCKTMGRFLQRIPPS
jgi:hypothetical protein